MSKGLTMTVWYKKNKKRILKAKRVWYQNNKKRAAIYQRWLVYGLTDKQYQAFKKKQKGRCALCKRKAKLDIDHCHKTNRVRGLLCRRCNVCLGWTETIGFKKLLRWTNGK